MLRRLWTGAACTGMIRGVEHLVDLDALASRLPHLERWKQSARVGEPTWRDEKAKWPQQSIADRSAVQVPESLGLRVSIGADEWEFVVWTGGWADAHTFVGGVLEPAGPEFVDADEAYAAVLSSINSFLTATTGSGHR